MREQFINKKLKASTLERIEEANEIIEEYQAQGFTLTLRQLYYQFVSRGMIDNNVREYKRLGSWINSGRLCGLIDWDAIEDRTRNVKKNLHLNSPADGIKLIRHQYGIDMWANQPTRIEVWIEKNALSGVIDEVCRENDVPYFACIGYVSQSEQYRAGKRFEARNDQDTLILHLGDHDPSGIDMTRDNQDRLSMFADVHRSDTVFVNRIALNMDQIDELNPPPNPAKTTDSRARDYIAKFGNESWELDALEPKMITSLIQANIDVIRDPELWEQKVEQRHEEIAVLDDIIANLS